MLFIVPDDQDETLDIPNLGDSDSPSGRKAVLDDAETTISTKKVDLDLDDAPFLEEEEEEEELLEEEQFELPTELGDSKDKKGLKDLLKNKFVLIGGASVLALALAAFFFLGGDSKPEEPVEEPVQVEEEQPAQEVVTEEVPEEVPGEVLVKLDPFLVEQRDAEGNLRFLEISLVFSTPEQMLADNLTRETPTVRYALFYYLRSKDLSILTDQNNVDNLKNELLSVVNQYMVTGQFETLLFEQYLVK